MFEVILLFIGFLFLFLGCYEIFRLKHHVSYMLGQEGIKRRKIQYIFTLYKNNMPFSLRNKMPFFLALHGIGSLFLFLYFFGQSPLFAFALTLFWGYGFFFWLKQKKHYELKMLNHSLPDFLELLTLFLDAGLSLGASFERLIPFFAKACPQLSMFLKKVAENLQKGETFADLFQKESQFFLPSRLSEIGFYIHQAEVYGTPLSQIFKTLADDMRQDHLIKLEEKAQKMGAILALPLILCFLPALLIIIFAPALLQLSENLNFIFNTL